MESVTVNPNMTKINGSCGMVQSQLNLTFSGGFLNIIFEKVIVALRGKECLGLGSKNLCCL